MQIIPTKEENIIKNLLISRSLKFINRVVLTIKKEITNVMSSREYEGVIGSKTIMIAKEHNPRMDSVSLLVTVIFLFIISSINFIKRTIAKKIIAISIRHHGEKGFITIKRQNQMADLYENSYSVYMKNNNKLNSAKLVSSRESIEQKIKIENLIIVAFF